MPQDDAVMADAIQPRLEFVYAASASLGEPITIGETPEGIRRIIPILSGTIDGPHIKGRILGGGSDWQVLRPDGVTVAVATYAMEAEDGTVIQIRNRGLRHGPADVMHRLATGAPVDPADYYFRTVPEFIAPIGAYDWLNKHIFLCAGARFPTSIKLWVWRVL